jgi:hypothetical protein
MNAEKAKLERAIWKVDFKLHFSDSPLSFSLFREAPARGFFLAPHAS